MCKWPGSQVQVQYCQQLDIGQQGQGLQFSEQESLSSEHLYLQNLAVTHNIG